VNQLDSNARLGRGDYLVAEADESDGSFLFLSPTVAVVTNVDREHLDHWTGGLDQIKDAFVSFLNRVPFYGLVVACLDDEGVQSLLPRLSRRVVTYGTTPQADVQADDIEVEGFGATFRVIRRGQDLGEFHLPLVGRHNVLNALAAIAIADELGVPPEQAREALKNFEGVQRRFTHRGHAAGVDVVDDYGHHPTEIRATLQAAKNAFAHRRIVALFQPHRYTRTRDLFDDFARAFNAADAVLVTNIYAASEAQLPGITPEALVERMREFGHRDAAVVGGLDDAIEKTAERLKDGDVLLTLGAGSVTRAGPEILKRLDDEDTP
jgi:UDP-N-acetylmuramate--alanine ligase